MTTVLAFVKSRQIKLQMCDEWLIIRSVRFGNQVHMVFRPRLAEFKIPLVSDLSISPSVQSVQLQQIFVAPMTG